MIVIASALAASLVAVPATLGSAWMPWSPVGNSSALGAAQPEPPISAVPADDARHGMVFRGLKPAKKGAPCVGKYEVEGTDHCSHGPDAAPPGLDVTRDVAPVVAGLPAPAAPRRERGAAPAEADVARDAGGTLAGDGAVALLPEAAAAPGGVAVGANGVVCEGDGQTGKRVQVLYVYGAGSTSRFAQYLPSFRTWAAGVDTIYDASAQETGGSRHLRYVTTADCQVDVREVEVGAAAIGTFSATITALRSLGYNRPDRKYMIFGESKVYCGIGSFAGDETPGAGNRSNGGPSYGRTDSGCWGPGTAAHELGHNLGAVNNNAPNSSKAGHCVDEYDVMCYKDAAGTVLRTACTDRAHNQRLDCNHDDYYHTNPSPGSYLATRWNVANSQFLVNGDGGTGGGTTPTPSGPPSRTPTRSPSAGPITTTPSATTSVTATATGSATPTTVPPSSVPQPPSPSVSMSVPPTTTDGPTGALATLSVGETTSSSVRLSWPADAAGARYGVAINGRTVGWTRATAARLTGLRADTAYEAQILLRNAGTVGVPYTKVLSLRTSAAQTPTAGWFSLSNALAGGAADLYGARGADRTPLVLERGTGSASQLWRLEPAGSGTYTLRSKVTGKCAAPLGGASVTGAPIVQEQCTAAAAAAVWRVKATANGFALTTADSGLVVGLGRSRYAGQRMLILQQAGQGRHQSWTAIPA